jgi:hypothetical protein
VGADVPDTIDHDERGICGGRALDTTGRILAERMRVSLGQPVIIENVTGAAGSIGVCRVAPPVIFESA